MKPLLPAPPQEFDSKDEYTTYLRDFRERQDRRQAKVDLFKSALIFLTMSVSVFFTVWGVVKLGDYLAREWASWNATKPYRQ